MDIRQEKKKKRQWVKEMQKILSAEEKRLSDEKICSRITELEGYRQAETIFCFVGTADEIDTSALLEQAWKDGKRVAVPRCEGKGIMSAYEIAGMEELRSGAYGILEPKGNCMLVQPEEIQFAVIPCVSCDRRGYRLGHGGGYYDRYLENTSFEMAAICREKLLLQETPIEEFDSQMNWVITENETIRTDRKI